MRTGRVVILTVAVLLLAPSLLSAQQFESLPEAKQESPATAAAGTGIKVGIIDIRGAMVNTQEGKKATEDLRAQFEPRRIELENLQREIREREEQLQTQQRTLSAEAQRQLVREIEAKRKQATRAEEDYRADIQQAEADLINRIGEKMRRILDRYAKEKGLSVIFDVSQGAGIVYAVPNMNITDEVVRLYDETYPVQTASGGRPGAPARPNQPQRQN